MTSRIVDDQQNLLPTQPQNPSPPPLQFPAHPIHLRCPFCLQPTKTQLVLKPQYTTIAISILAFLLLPHILNLIAVVFIFQLTSVCKHRCPLCERELGSDGRFLYYLKDEVYSVNLQGSGLIVSKKILVNVAITVLVLAVLWVRGSERWRGLVFTDGRWEEFREVCARGRVGNSRGEMQVCLQKYEGKTVKNWRGFVMRIKDNRKSMMRFYENHATIYLKLFPTEFQTEPELKLTMDSFTVSDYDSELDSLHHGDEIEFNATVMGVAGHPNSDNLRHFHLTGLRVTKGHREDIPYYYLKYQQMEDIPKTNLKGNNG